MGLIGMSIGTERGISGAAGSEGDEIEKLSQSTGGLGLESPEIMNPSESWDPTESHLIPRENTGTRGAP